MVQVGLYSSVGCVNITRVGGGTMPSMILPVSFILTSTTSLLIQALYAMGASCITFCLSSCGM